MLAFPTPDMLVSWLAVVAFESGANLDMREPLLNGIHGDLSNNNIDFRGQIGALSEKPLILSGLFYWIQRT